MVADIGDVQLEAGNPTPVPLPIENEDGIPLIGDVVLEEYNPKQVQAPLAKGLTKEPELESEPETEVVTIAIDT